MPRQRWLVEFAAPTITTLGVKLTPCEAFFTSAAGNCRRAIAAIWRDAQAEGMLALPEF
ncbi:MAG TPA: hypothetical protein VMH87_04895 [Pseudomonadales bacterium]|nr:hypothetical protein [Pseudomonadales bacterium]